MTYPCSIQSREHARHGVKTRQDGWSGSTPPEVDRELGWPVLICHEATVSARASSLATRKKQNGNTMDQRICERARQRERDALLTFTGSSLNHWLQRRSDGEGDPTAAAVKFLAMALRGTEGRAQTCESREAISACRLVHGVDVGRTGRSRR